MRARPQTFHPAVRPFVLAAALTLSASCDRKSPPAPPSAPAASASGTRATTTASAPASAESPGASAEGPTGSHAASGRDVLVELLAKHANDLRTLDDLPRLLPPELTRSFVLKHGRDRKGERGHLVETRISQSADPLAPRAIVWDERRALFVSYNGGLPTQKNGQRLDVLSWDEATRAFALEAVAFPPATDGGATLERSNECATCHGPRSRPIFSMYPDWPGFYGSDNDELNNPRVAVQAAELADYRRFRAEVAKRHPRYRPLFEGDGADAETFPYRPDVSEEIHARSRAFRHRPGLRLGLLLNRLQARSIVAHVTRHPRYSRFGAFFLSHLLMCRSPLPPDAEVEAALGEPVRRVAGGPLVHYRQLWKLFDLEVRDVDIRYSYPHAGYRSDDASKNPMAVGYVGTYWNSYFDGSATIDELVAHGLYAHRAKEDATIAGLVTPSGLTRKYKHLSARYALDETFFAAMDAAGLWIPIPYPRSLHEVHHREGFPPDHQKQHDALCAALTRAARKRD